MHACEDEVPEGYTIVESDIPGESIKNWECPICHTHYLIVQE